MSIKLRQSILIILFMMFFTVGYNSCGLDTFYLLRGPFDRINYPNIDNYDPSLMYFEFRTNENDYAIPLGDFKFLGTDVYYKIYTSDGTLKSHINSIDSVNTETNYGTAADYVITRYRYQKLRIDKVSDDSVFVPAMNPRVPPYSQRVKIRLTDLNPRGDSQKDLNNSPRVFFDGVEKGAPIRTTGNGSQKLNFDFGRAKFSESEKPRLGDADFEGSESESTFYVNMYAIAVGYDLSFKNSYSNVLHLGTVTINSESDIN